MYVTKELSVGLAMGGERFQRELVVQARFTAMVLVRRVDWAWWDYGQGNCDGHLLAIGRWIKRDGTYSEIDARSPITEDQLPAEVLAKLKELKGESS